MNWLDSLIAEIDRINPIILLVFLYGISMITYTIYRYRKDSGSTAIQNRDMLRAFLGKRNTHEGEKTFAESISLGRVAEIYAMTDTKEKGDALEDLTKDIYRILGYKAQTVREMKASGKLPGLTGTDQGGDVIAELFNDKKEVVERLLIQCKAYKYMDDASGNDAVHKTNSAKDYYEDLLGVPIDRAILVTTSPKMTVAARDAANRVGVEIIDNDQTLGADRQPKSKLINLIRKANAKLLQRSLKAS